MTLAEFYAARLDDAEREETGLAKIFCVDISSVLRDIEAKRKILAAYVRSEAVTPVRGWESDYTQALEYVVRVFAAVCDGHPDYNPAWAPA